MTDDDTRWADQLLERARATAAPRTEDADRNLASIEARLGMGPGVGPGASETARQRATNGVGRSISAGAAGGLRVSSVARVGLLQSGGPQSSLVKGSLVKGSLVKGSLVKGSLVLAFGAATGILGYLIGRAETAQDRAELAIDAAAALAAPPVPVATRRDAVAPAAPVPVEPSPALQAEEASAASQAEEASAAPPSHRSVAVARRAHRTARGVFPSEREESALAPSASRASAAAEPTADRAAPFPLSEALELLRRAEAAVRHSDGLQAKMWLSDLDRRAAPQLLVEERLVTLTLAQCVLGEVEAARETRRALESANAESIYRARLEGSCVADRKQGR